MTTPVAAAIGSVVVAGLLAWVLPALGMAILMPSLEASARKVRNHRGVEVSTGLGIVWLLWALAVLLAVAKVSVLSVGGFGPALDQEYLWSGWLAPATLVVMAFAFGLVDDVFGGSEAKGFKGHLKALAKGRLTTGGLKLLGIGLASAVAAFWARSSLVAVDRGISVADLAAWALATLTIALAANFINLTDLRPGRSLKAYGALVILALPGVAWSAAGQPSGSWTMVAVTAVLALGPVLAVWRYDLGERGMLGDAGANAMGALAGYLFAGSLPLWGLAVTTIVFLALNLASERISFSKVIEGNGALRWLDGLGRLRPPSAAPGMERPDGDSAVHSDTHDEAIADTRKDGGN